MAHVRESDTALWLHNKLGSSEELWIPSSISGIIKTDTIDNIYRCFPVLTTTVKVKLLLGILHLPRRSIEEMQHMIEGIIEVALEDPDMWVRLVANMVRTYPTTFNLNLNLRPSPIANNVVQQLSDKVKEADPYSSLPLECQLVNKTSLQSLVGNLPPVSRHFALKRKPKSAALRADLMHKSNEAVSHMKKGGLGGAGKSVPVKHRDMTRRSSDVTPLKRIPSRGPPNRLDSFRGTSTPSGPAVNRSVSRVPARQQAGGTKLLDISEQPIGGSGIGVRDSKRRKKQLQQQESLVASQTQEDEEEVGHDKTPEYAAGLPSVMTSQSMEEDTEDASSQEASSSSTPHSFTNRRTTTESMEHDESSESEAEQIEITTPAKTLYFDRNKTTSSDSDLTSPQTSGTSANISQEEKLSPKKPMITSPTIFSTPSTTPTTPPVKHIEPPSLHQTTPPVTYLAYQPPLTSPAQRHQPQHQSTASAQQAQMHLPPSSVPRTGVQPTGVPRTGVPLTGVPRTGVQPTGVPRTGVPQTGVPLTGSQPTGSQQKKPTSSIQLPTPPQLPTTPNHLQTSPRMVVPTTYIMTSQRQASTVIQSPQRLLISPQRNIQQQQQTHTNPTVQHFYQPHMGHQPQVQQRQSSHHPRPQQPPTVYMKLPTQQQPQQLNPPAPKKGLTLTREQMFQAQEMFKSANRLSRPEKAIILGFMAGSRENPYPDQGDIVQIVLSEGVQSIANPNGGILPVIVETLYEMNYRTGQAGKRQRLKQAPLPPPGVGM